MKARMGREAGYNLPWFLRDGSDGIISPPEPSQQTLPTQYSPPYHPPTDPLAPAAGVETWAAIKHVFIYNGNQRADAHRVSMADAPETIHSNFDFARYISVCLDGVIADVITFSEVTWVFVLVIYIFHSIPGGVFDYGNVGTINGIEFQLATIAGGVPIIAYLIIFSATYDLKTMAERAQMDPPHLDTDASWLTFLFSTETIDEASFETYVARVLQALMFVLCYSVSRLLGSKTFWQNNDVEEMILFLYYVFLFFYTGYVLMPEAVVTASVAFCMPPYVDNHDWACALACQRHADRLAESGMGKGRSSIVLLERSKSMVDDIQLQMPGVSEGGASVEIGHCAPRGCASSRF